MDFQANVFTKYDRDWALLTAGDKDDFNTMTISWGGFGTLWSKPVVTVYVRPTRYTHTFMEKSDCFTVSFYKKGYRKALSILGTLSGRDCDKVKKAGLTAKALENGVTFEEASQTLVCKKIYRQELDAKMMPDHVVRENYDSNEKPHTMYIGEVVGIIEK